MERNAVAEILMNHVPETARAYALQLWEEKPFALKLTRGRQTKVGDFTCKRHGAHPRITLNHDLNPYLFLITYVHEVAHWRVYVQHGHRVDPHGEQWKNAFRDLMIPVMTDNVFPETILGILRRHMENPKASSFADTTLTQALRTFDANHDQQLALGDIPEGSIFKLQGRYYKKGALRRTRVLCREVQSRRQYLVPADALVSDVQLSLL